MCTKGRDVISSPDAKGALLIQVDAEPDVKKARLDFGEVPCVRKVANAADRYMAVLQMQEHVPSPGAPRASGRASGASARRPKEASWMVSCQRQHQMIR